MQLSDRRSDNDHDYDRDDHDRDSRNHDEHRAEGGYRVCDSDGDRCYMGESHHWEFHGYVDSLHRHHHHHHHHHVMHSWREDNRDNGYEDRERGDESYEEHRGYDNDRDRDRDHDYDRDKNNSHWTDGYGRQYDSDQDSGH
ncbi:MAG: hypothetical protein JOZ55_04370 [Alphaproteobacteria bacterium]|nr:hypothetical protein [Alphaproteobacteria bacterium]